MGPKSLSAVGFSDYDQTMSTEKTDALVIRQTDFSETSKVLTFFTREFGKISVIAKGARRLKGPFEAALDLLSVCRIVFIRKSTQGLDILTEAQLASRFKPAGRDMSRLYGGYYVAELLGDLTEEYDPHPLLFDDAVATLTALAQDTHVDRNIVRFELGILREIGQLPAFDACIACGKPVTSSASYGFWVSQGGLICQSCRHEKFEQRLLHAGTIRLLQALADRDAAFERLTISPAQVKEIRHVVTAAISHALGRRPKMSRYLHL